MRKSAYPMALKCTGDVYKRQAYCCTPGADGQPKNCPTYTYVDTSMVGADQYVPEMCIRDSLNTVE